MVRALLFATLFALVPTAALAVDYDYESARSRWQIEKTELDSAEASLSRYRSSLNDAQQVYSAAVSRLDDITDELQANRDRQQALHRSVTADYAEIQNQQTRRNDYTRRIDSANQQIDRIRTQRNDADADVRDYQQQLNEVERRIRVLEDQGQDSPELTRLRQERANLQSSIDRGRQNVRNYDNQIANLHNQVDDYWSNVQAIDQQITRLNGEIRGMEDEISDLEFAEDRLGLDLQNAQNRVADARSARDRAQTNFDAAQRSRDQQFQEERSAYAYYQEVLDNYNRAYSSAQLKGQGDGQRDGGREATERATPVAQNAGTTSGDTAGRAAGLAAARVVQGVLGYNAGLQTGADDDRLIPSYREGQAAGQTWAADEARSENHPLGYNARMNEVLAVPPTNSVNYDISTELPELPAGEGPLLDPKAQPVGSVASPSYSRKDEPAVAVPPADRPVVTSTADRRYYAPACGGQPLPVFTQACENSYQTAYVGGFGSLYQNAYLSVYRPAFDRASDSAYRSARQTAFPDIWLAEAKLGAIDGGKLQGYAAAIDGARTAATAAGRLAFDTYRRTGFLLLLRQVELVDAVVDTVLSPGEQIKIKIVVDNYGLSASKLDGIRLSLVDPFGGVFEVLFRALPVFAADTETTLMGVIKGKVGTLANGNVRFKAKLELVDGENVSVIDEAAFEKGIRSPIELSAVTFPASLVVGREGAAVLKLKNNTSLDLEAMTLPLRLPGDGLTSTATTVALPALASEAVTEIQVPVTATVYAGGNVPALFEITASGVAGAGDLVIAGQAAVPVTRNGQLDLCLQRCGDVVSLPLRVTAGSTLRLPAQFTFKGTQTSTFQFGKLQVSDARITSANGSTVSVGPSQWGPGSSPYRADFSYVIPSALRGTTQWVTLYLKERSTTIHVIKVPFTVQ